MKKNGFIASALLYGMLALFLVMMLSTLAILANRKLSVDKLKENAITAAETGYSSPENIIVLYDAIQKPASNEWKDQSGHGSNAKVSNNGKITFSSSNKYLQFASGGYIDTQINQKKIKDLIDTNDKDRNFTIVTTIAFQSGFPADQTLWGYNEDYIAQTGGSGTYAITTSAGLKICVFDDRCSKTKTMNIDDENKEEHIFCQYDPTDTTSETNTNRDNKDSTNETCVNIPKSELQVTTPVQLVVTLGNGGIATFINGKPSSSGTTGLGTLTFEGSPYKANFKPLDAANIIIGAKDTSKVTFSGRIYNFILYKGSLSYPDGTSTNKYSFDIPANCKVDKDKYGISTTNC